MFNGSYLEKIENWAGKVFQDGVEIIYSLGRYIVTLLCIEG